MVKAWSSYFLVTAIKEEMSSLKTRYAFGAGLDLDLLGIDVDDNTLIPGLAVATSRAIPLAGTVINSDISNLPSYLLLNLFGKLFFF